MRLEHKDNPTEDDFPLIDRCVECDGVCEWQPRYERACRDDLMMQKLIQGRPLGFTPEARVVKICAGCLPDDLRQMKLMIRFHYPAYAQNRGI